MERLKSVIIRYRGVPIAPRTNINNIADPITGETVIIGGGGSGVIPTSVKYASSADMSEVIGTSVIQCIAVDSNVSCPLQS